MNQDTSTHPPSHTELLKLLLNPDYYCPLHIPFSEQPASWLCIHTILNLQNSINILTNYQHSMQNELDPEEVKIASMK